jgi:hypothetical protein
MSLFPIGGLKYSKIYGVTGVGVQSGAAVPL